MLSRLKRAVPLAFGSKTNPFYSIHNLTQLETKLCAQSGVPCYIQGMLILVSLGPSGVDVLIR